MNKDTRHMLPRDQLYMRGTERLESSCKHRGREKMFTLQIALLTLGLVCLSLGNGKTPNEDAVLDFEEFIEDLLNKTQNTGSERVDLTGRVVGGTETAVGELPFMASLRFPPYYHFCGGSILSPRYILTAAHCVTSGYTSDPSNFEVVVGEHDTSGHEGREQVLQVEEIKSHPNYDDYNVKNDVALLKLKTDIDFSTGTAAPVGLPCETDCDAMTYDDCIIAGWGTTSSDGTLSDVLLSAPTEVLNDSECTAAYGSETNTKKEICARADGIDTCQGDSGGPLTCKNSDGNHVQFGIVSWGYGCAHPDYPGIYTRVCEYRWWIAINMTC